MPDPILDESTPCCKDFSRFATEPDFCDQKTLAPGATGGSAFASTGTWTPTLNAAGGGTGGGSGIAYYQPDPIIAESWG